jgi:hypothetical protein
MSWEDLEFQENPKMRKMKRTKTKTKMKTKMKTKKWLVTLEEHCSRAGQAAAALAFVVHHHQVFPPATEPISPLAD